eukprot:scaffold2324_cov116-Cylindrotheca_fusiformis.AAC.6
MAGEAGTAGETVTFSSLLSFFFHWNVDKDAGQGRAFHHGFFFFFFSLCYYQVRVWRCIQVKEKDNNNKSLRGKAERLSKERQFVRSEFPCFATVRVVDLLLVPTRVCCRHHACHQHHSCMPSAS